MTHDEIKKLDNEFIQLDRLQLIKKGMSGGIESIHLMTTLGSISHAFYASNDMMASSTDNRIDSKLYKQIVDGINDDIDDQIDALQSRLTKLKTI